MLLMAKFVSTQGRNGTENKTNRQYPININSQYFSKRTHTCQLMQYRYASEKRIFSQVMAPDNRHREILAAIEGPLLNIQRELKALSPADRKKLISDERDRLMGLTRNVLANRRKTFLESTIDWIQSTLLEFFGFDPFKWCYFEEYDHNAEFANRAFSNPSLYDALEQAGQILEEKQSPHLKNVSHYFNQKVTSARDVERAANAIIDFCKCLPTASNGYRLHIERNDIKLLLMETIKLLLTSEVSRERFERLHSNPLVLESGELCWVKYKFVSNTYIEKIFICEEKFVNMDVTIWYYWFPSECDFRVALRNIERDK